MNIDSIDDSAVTLEQTVRLFPNLATLHEDTQIWAYREFKPMKDKVEITLFWREPGKEKMRLDAEVEGAHLTEGIELRPEDVRLVSLGDARKAVR